MSTLSIYSFNDIRSKKGNLQYLYSGIIFLATNRKPIIIKKMLYVRIVFKTGYHQKVRNFLVVGRLSWVSDWKVSRPRFFRGWIVLKTDDQKQYTNMLNGVVLCWNPYSLMKLLQWLPKSTLREWLIAYLQQGQLAPFFMSNTLVVSTFDYLFSEFYAMVKKVD